MNQVRKYLAKRRVYISAVARGLLTICVARSSNAISWLNGCLFARPTLIFLAACFYVANAQADNRYSPFAVGQEWSIKCEHPTTTKVIIDRIEGWKDKTVVHVSIVDIPSAASQVGAAAITRIDHLPFEESALTASVDKLLVTGVPPPLYFEAGYKQWKDHNGGIYTITIAELLSTVFSTT